MLSDPRVSIVRESWMAYPAGPFDPDERYPEAISKSVSPSANGVYRAVRESFRQIGLDAGNFDTPGWNPLSEYIRPGQRVFLLCNFVHDRRRFETRDEFLSKCTHASVIRAVADYALIALEGKGEIIIGNAPLQSCDWNAVLDETGTTELMEFYRRQRANVRTADLRCHKVTHHASGRRSSVRTDGIENAVMVDLGERSLLAEGTGSTAFAVCDYNPEETLRHHTGGRHEYAIHREILESDVIIGVPKLKVHEKVGLTCALKNFVGIAALKQSLPHHRTGAARDGGDEYPDGSVFGALASRTHAWYSRRPPGVLSNGPLAIGDRAIRRLCLRTGDVLAGAWHGNDTAWRMACDLVSIAQYADARGVMQPRPQRRLLTVTDGVVAGEGNGPLAPRPAPLGMVLFSDDPVLMDWACSELIGFDARKIPLVYRTLARSGIDPERGTAWRAVLNRESLPISDLHQHCERPLCPPPGWRNHIEREFAHAAH